MTSFCFGGVSSAGAKVAAKSRLVLKEVLWRGCQPAWELRCQRLKLIVTKHGLNLASVSLVDDDSNTSPFWLPHWGYSNPERMEVLNLDAAQSAVYGNREDSVLLAAVCGHSLCVDRFGASSKSEENRGVHGEAAVARWQLQRVANDNASFCCSLPLAQLFLQRSFSFDGDRVYVATAIQDTRSQYEKFLEKGALDAELDEIHEEVICERTNVAGNSATAGVLSETGSKKERLLQRYKRQAVDSRHNYHILQASVEEEYSQRLRTEALKQKLTMGSSKRKLRLSKAPQSDEHLSRLQRLGLAETDMFAFAKRRALDGGAHVCEDATDKYLVDDLQKARFDVDWCEVAAIGDPFLEGAQVASHCLEDCYNFCEAMPHSRFGDRLPCDKVPLEEVLQMPAMADTSARVDECTAARVSKGVRWANLKVENKAIGYELEYDYDANVWPWLTLWTEHFCREQPPWNGRTRVRAFEFSTKPFPIPELHKELPSDRISTDGGGVHLFDSTPINYTLPFEGSVECFSFRWNYLGVNE